MSSKTTALDRDATTQLRWSDASTGRNEITDLYEPIQPWVFLAAVDVLGARSVLDVGANVGYYSLISTLPSSVCEVVGFEAAPAAAAEFRQNVMLNSLEDVVSLAEVAVCDQVGEAEFLICSDLSGINALAASTMHRRAKYGPTPIMVPTVSLDAWYLTHSLPEGPIGVKVDVEGSESSVFKGAERLFRSREIVLQAEMYEGNRERDTKILEQMGLELLVRCENDWFWTNSPELMMRWREVVELAMTNCVRARMRQLPPVFSSRPALSVEKDILSTGAATGPEVEPVVPTDVVEVRTLDVEYRIAAPDWEQDYIQGRLRSEAVPYEYEMLADIAERYPGGGTAVDVGANIGNHSLFLAAHGFDVYAYEPNARLAELVERSARLNGFSAVHVRKCAVGAGPGRGRFLRLVPENLGAQQVVSDADGELEVVALDDEEIPGRVDVLKIDVEGGERDVLVGARRILRRDRPTVYVECQDISAFLEIDRWMSNERYVVRDVFNATPTMLYVPSESLDGYDGPNRAMARVVTAGVYDRKRIREIQEKLADTNRRYGELRDQMATQVSERQALVATQDATTEEMRKVVRERDELRRLLEATVRQRDDIKDSLERTENDMETMSATLKGLRSSVTMRTGAAVRSAVSSPRRLVGLPLALWRLARSRERQVEPHSDRSER